LRIKEQETRLTLQEHDDDDDDEMFYSGNIMRRKILVNVSKNSDPDVGLRKPQYATRFHWSSD